MHTWDRWIFFPEYAFAKATPIELIVKTIGNCFRHAITF